MKNTIPKNPELRAGPKEVAKRPVGRLTSITGGRYSGKYAIQFGLRKVKAMNDFKLDELKSGIDGAILHPDKYPFSTITRT